MQRKVKQFIQPPFEEFEKSIEPAQLPTSRSPGRPAPRLPRPTLTFLPERRPHFAEFRYASDASHFELSNVILHVSVQLLVQEICSCIDKVDVWYPIQLPLAPSLQQGTHIWLSLAHGAFDLVALSRRICLLRGSQRWYIRAVYQSDPYLAVPGACQLRRSLARSALATRAAR